MSLWKISPVIMLSSLGQVPLRKLTLLPSDTTSGYSSEKLKPMLNCKITLNLGKKPSKVCKRNARRSGHNKRIFCPILLRRILYSGAQRVPWPNDGAKLKLRVESDTGNVLLIWQISM